MEINDAVRTISKWMNEEQTAPIDRVALATILAAWNCRESGQLEPVALWEGSEEWEQLAYELCCEECDDPHQLIWEGGPIPEPWGERWQRYEGDAKRMIELVRKYVPCARCADVCERCESTVIQSDNTIITDLQGKLAALEAENKERDLQLRHLLCIIHRDGGHRTQAHGLEQSIEDAKEKFFDLRDLPDTVAQQAERIKYLEDISNRSESAIKTLAEQLAAAEKIINKISKWEGGGIEIELASWKKAEKDAERYRWLRKEHAAVWPSIHVRDQYSDVLPSDLDAAIDAASREGK